jgi:cytochrome c biogenesis protein
VASTSSTSETIYRSVASVWRTLRSMRTALILLLLVGVASTLGSLVPQVVNSPDAVADLFQERPLLAQLYRALGLFDVYGAWWFTLLYILLLISLASCLIPRTRAMVRGLGRRPAPARELEGLRHFEEGTVEGGPAVALERSRRILRRRRYRVARDGDALAAEKGASRESGSLLFHWSVFVILVGAVYGKGFGFTGQATIVEGETWTETHTGYSVPPQEGRFFSESMHTGFQVKVEDFDASFHPTGVPRDFVSRVELIEADGTSLGRREIRVNDPLEHAGVKLYQAGYGWAPVLEVRQGDRLLASGPVVFITDTPNDLTRPWRGVIKLPSLEPQVGLEFELLPDSIAALGGGPMLEARNPFLFFQAWRGDLRLSAAQSVFRLDKRDLEPWESGGVGLGQSVTLPGDLKITFVELREYTQLLVKRDPGLGIMLAGAALLLIGLLPALYSSRRKVWVRAEPDGERTRLQVGGFALQRKAAFEDEFRELVGELVQ